MHWRTPITLAVLLVILLGAAYYGWQTVVDPATDSGGPTTPTPSTSHHTTPQVCLQKKTYPKGTTIQASSFKVNVFNAGSVSGQAGSVLASLHTKGFQDGIASDPPAKVTATNVSILTSTPNSPLARLVAEQFKGKVLLVPGPNLAVGVDIVIGNSFIGVDPAAPSSLTLQEPATVCVKFKSS